MEKGNNKFGSKEKVFLGSIAILYRLKEGRLEFLVVENSKTKNITFVSGAKEDVDFSEIDTVNREVQEELGLRATGIKFRPTEVRHEFVFSHKKEDRAGQHGSYQVFLADITDISDSIAHTEELRGIKWLSKVGVVNSLSFPDLKNVFLKATEDLH